MLAIEPPFPQYYDLDGSPLDAGAIYIGSPNLDPIAHPVPVFWDAAGTIPASQPIATLNGYPVRSGAPAVVYVAGNYSVLVRDRRGRQVAYAHSAASASNGVALQAQLDNLDSPGNGFGADMIGGVGRVTDSIAALRGLSKTGSARAFVLGYYAPGDGGGGPYYCDTADTSSADNGGSVIVGADGGRWKLVCQGTIFAKQFGAKSDGTDQTAAIQAAVNALPAGVWLDGAGDVYTVKSVALKSGARLKDMRLRTAAGSEDFVSPILIDGRVSAKTGILLHRVLIDGNRQNQTGIVAAAENGGRHGFRVLGRVTDLEMLACEAMYCAGDGLEMYSAGDVVAAFERILIQDCRFEWNRRHGASLDSAARVKLLRVDANNNGLDLDTLSAMTSGMRGDRAAGQLYGNGFDVEGYGNHSNVSDVSIVDCTMLGNARAGLLAFPNETTAGFLPWVDWRISGGRYDEGVDASKSGYSIELTPPASTPAGEVHFRRIALDGVSLNTPIIARNAQGSRFGGAVRYPAGKTVAALINCQDVTVDLASSQDAGDVYAVNSRYARPTREPTAWLAAALPVVAFVAGATGTIDSLTSELLDYDGRGYVRHRLRFRYIATSSGWSSFSITVNPLLSVLSVTANATSSTGVIPAAMNFETATPRLFAIQAAGVTAVIDLVVTSKIAGT